MSYFLGAYASSPNVSSWDPAIESDYYDKLKQISHLTGLEHPFLGSLHNQDDQWFLDNIDPNWNFVFTCVPGIMSAIKSEPRFGLASTNETGRQAALSFMKAALLAIDKLNSHLKRQAVKAIQIQTSPNQSKSPASEDALYQSLKEMSQWQWQGTKIVIEHCDTLIEGQVPAKGFLSLEQEISALKQVNEEQGCDMGISINWGRSVIETRSVEGALQHIKQAKENDLLSGLMFSGVSDQETDYIAWKDSHMPPAKAELGHIGAEGSLMTEQQMHACLALAEPNTLDFIGVKIGIRPHSSPIEERIAYNSDALAIIERFKGQ